MTAGRPILIVAGEASGDRYGAGLARAIRALDPSAGFAGMGGRMMREAGVETLVDSEPLAVTGLVEVLWNLRTIRAAMRTLEEALRARGPRAVVLVDYPDFNLRLARSARRAGIPVIYFVSPQLWAWRPGRARTIADTVDRMLVIFPFEETFYRDLGIHAEFVGHPLAEELSRPVSREAARRSLGLPPSSRCVALLPGSRPNEVSRLLPVLLGAAERLGAKHPDLRFLVARAPGLPDFAVPGPGVPARIHALAFEGRMREVVRAADVALCAMGTATLETALLRTPFVALYRLHPLSYSIARRMVRLRSFAMPNLVLGAPVFPELVQVDCTPDRVAAEAAAILSDPSRRQEMEEACDQVRQRLLGASGNLTGGDAYRRAAERILGVAR